MVRHWPGAVSGSSGRRPAIKMISVAVAWR
jgi:hypothetical protein